VIREIKIIGGERNHCLKGRRGGGRHEERRKRKKKERERMGEVIVFSRSFLTIQWDLGAPRKEDQTPPSIRKAKKGDYRGKGN